MQNGIFGISALLANISFGWKTEHRFAWEQMLKNKINKLLWHLSRCTASKSRLHQCWCVRALPWPVANQLAVAEGRVNRQDIDWIRNWKGEGQGEGSGIVLVFLWDHSKNLANWEKLVGGKYFRTSVGLKLKDVWNIWRNVKNSTLWKEKNCQISI